MARKKDSFSDRQAIVVEALLTASMHPEDGSLLVLAYLPSIMDSNLRFAAPQPGVSNYCSNGVSALTPPLPAPITQLGKAFCPG